MTAKQFACVSCAEVFTSAHEKASHWVAVHDRGLLPRSERMKRSSYCWRCANEIPVGENTCSCGWSHPNTNTEGNK
jgi:hypothetical protein